MPVLLPQVPKPGGCEYLPGGCLLQDRALLLCFSVKEPPQISGKKQNKDEFVHFHYSVFMYSQILPNFVYLKLLFPPHWPVSVLGCMFLVPFFSFLFLLITVLQLFHSSPDDILITLHTRGLWAEHSLRANNATWCFGACLVSRGEGRRLRQTFLGCDTVA